MSTTSSSSSSDSPTPSERAHDLLSKASDQLVSRGYPSLTTLAQRPGLTPYPAIATSALCFASAIPALRGGRGWPGYFPSVGFGAIFAGASYVLLHDLDNGTSTATAWGVVYTSLFLRSTIASRRIGPIGLLACVMGTTGVYGVEMWDSFFG
ncbi:hypothetical protein SpCBS45565_g06953 [Spizellomyces sp. 'palustris']|nr:hypothetical protein SpCBS45565_g06953 [Spizellomyces sp. 'palustris']